MNFKEYFNLTEIITDPAGMPVGSCGNCVTEPKKFKGISRSKLEKEKRKKKKKMEEEGGTSTCDVAVVPSKMAQKIILKKKGK